MKIDREQGGANGFRVLVPLALTLLGGCLSVGMPEPGASVHPATGKGIVFGQVRVFDRGNEISPWKVDSTEIAAEDPVIRLSLFNVESGRKRPYARVSAEGRFEWILQAGTYLLYHTPSVEPATNEPLAAFQVPDGSDAVDLGELRLLISVDRPLSWSLATYTLSEIEARAADAQTAAWFLQNHPGTGSVRQGAFVVDPELSGLFMNYSRESCARILARHGIEIEHHESK